MTKALGSLNDSTLLSTKKARLHFTVFERLRLLWSGHMQIEFSRYQHKDGYEKVSLTWAIGEPPYDEFPAKQTITQ